jgi:hypothetical protein
MDLMYSFKTIALIAVVGSLAISCRNSLSGFATDTRRNSVVIKQGNPQQFIISAHGPLDVFTVNGPRLPDGTDKYWVIAPLDPNFESAQLTQPIIYGHVPPGFRQVAPLNNQPPPPITDGYPYGVELDIRNGDKVHMLFSVQNGKITTEADVD